MKRKKEGLAIAENLYEMMTLKTPVISVFIGEGGSGGALALAVADKVIMLENAFYSVISPEGCASILWKNAKKKKESAEALKLTAKDLHELDVAEYVVKERDTDRGFRNVYSQLENLLYEEFSKLRQMSDDELLAARYEKFRKIGRYE